MEQDEGVADAQFGVLDAPGLMGVPDQEPGIECPAVELDGRVRVPHDELRGDGVEPLGDATSDGRADGEHELRPLPRAAAVGPASTSAAAAVPAPRPASSSAATC